MSWQDDLRQLDSALAEGRISADDYRRRRDELLASASTAQPPNPFGQPFRWDSQQGGTPGPDATQVVGQRPNPDATQVVSNQGPTQNPAQNKDSERTQFVRPVAPPQTGGQPQQPQGGWQSGPPGPPQAGTPWGGNDMYTSGDQSPAWIAQGPEVFDDSSSSGTGKRILIILGVVVLLAGIGFGIWFFTKGSGDNRGGGGGETTTAGPTTTTKPKPTDPHEILLEQIPELNAKMAAESGVPTPAELVTKKVLSQSEAQLLTENKVTKTAWRGATKSPAVDGQGSEKFSVLVIPTADEASATGLAEQLLLNQRATGFINIKDPLPEMPGSLVFDKKIAPEAGTYRGVWTSGKNIVVVEITQTPLIQEPALSGSYQNQVKAVLKQYPAVQ